MLWLLGISLIFRKIFFIFFNIFLWKLELKNIKELNIIMWGNIPIGNNTNVNKWKNTTNKKAASLVLDYINKKGILIS